MRTINIAGEPYLLALSCDHAMLSICYTLNGISFIDIYAVQTFLSNVSPLFVGSRSRGLIEFFYLQNVQCLLSKIMVSNDPSVKVKQILWNPVISNTMALCLGDGTLGAYVIKENSFEYNSLDKSEMSR